LTHAPLAAAAWVELARARFTLGRVEDAATAAQEGQRLSEAQGLTESLLAARMLHAASTGRSLTMERAAAATHPATWLGLLGLELVARLALRGGQTQAAQRQLQKLSRRARDLEDGAASACAARMVSRMGAVTR
jgi:hypothetical protein